jgi:hypothetical protein
MYGLNDRPAALYRLSYPARSFQRWDRGVWVDASARYERVTQDAANDEVDLETAVTLMKSWAQPQ